MGQVGSPTAYNHMRIAGVSSFLSREAVLIPSEQYQSTKGNKHNIYTVLN